MLQISISRAVGSLPIFTTFALLTALPAPARAARYRFEKIADSVQDNFNVNTFTCANINKHGEVVFKATRTHPDGVNFFDGIYRRNKNGTLTIIVEDPDRTQFTFLGDFPSINDSGEVAFAANLATEEFINAILVGDGGGLTTIASSAGKFRFPFFNISINKKGEVAFNAQLDPEFNSDLGLFSGSGGAVATHYLNSADILLDRRPARFTGSFGRPSINKKGDIAFSEHLSGDFAPGVFVGQNGRFKTIASAAPFEASFGDPVLNDKGTAAFETSFFDSNGEFVTAIVKSDGGPLMTIVDTNGPFGFFDSQAPSINDKGDVVFFGLLDDFSTSGIFTGPNPTADKVIATGDALDGATVTSFGLHLCQQAVNDSGQVAFVALLDDPATPFGVRSVVFRATPLHHDD